MTDITAIDVSFIVTIYNKSDHIPDMVRGISEQRGQFTREYIFIDDGSTDNSLSLLTELTQVWHNVTILTQINQGVSCALNNGIKAAKGRYLKFVDGDDTLDPLATQTMLSVLADYPQAAVCFGRAKSGKPSNQTQTLSKASIYCIKNPLIPLLKGQYHQINSIGATPSIALREAVLKVGLTDERVRIQDFPLALRLAHHFSFVYIDAVVCWCPESLTNRLSSNKQCEVFYTLMTLKLFLTEHSLSGKEVSYCVKRAVKRFLKEGLVSAMTPAQRIKLLYLKKGG